MANRHAALFALTLYEAHAHWLVRNDHLDMAEAAGARAQGILQARHSEESMGALWTQVQIRAAVKVQRSPVRLLVRGVVAAQADWRPGWVPVWVAREQGHDNPELIG